MPFPLLIPIVDALLGAGKEIIDRTVPDKVAAEKAKEELEAKVQDEGFQAQLAQISVDQEEAKSPNIWVAGWRPGIGWVCVAILALSYLPKALALTGFWAYQCYLTFAHPEVKLPQMPIFPDIGLSDVLGILGTLLGAGWMATLRTEEKKAGVHNLH